MRRAEQHLDPSSVARRAGLVAIAFLAGIAFHVVTAGPSGSSARSSTATGGDGAVELTSGPGPTRTEHGAPAGFSHDIDGAMAAARAFVCSGSELLSVDPLAAEDAIRQMASSASGDEQTTAALARLGALRDRLSAGSGPIALYQAVLAARVETFTDERARIALWNVGVLSRDGVAPPQASWSVSTLDLVWERNDWHLDHETVVAGPAPVLDNSTAPATATQFDAALDGFKETGDLP